MAVKQSQSGGAAIVFLLFFALALGSYLLFAGEGLVSSKAHIRGGTNGHRIGASVMARLKEILAGNIDCQVATDLAPFRVFSAKANPYRIKRTGPGIQIPCLVEAVDGKDLEEFSLEIVETMRNAEDLLRTAKVTLDLKVRSVQGSPTRPVKLMRSFRISVVSLDYFNAVFVGDQFPLVQTQGPQLTLTGLTYYAGRTSPTISDIYQANNNGTVSFRHPFLVRPRALSAPVNTYDWSEVRPVFQMGIETGILATSAVDNYLPDLGPAWNYRFDYSYAGSGEGYPLPGFDNKAGAIDCEPTLAFNDTRGNIVDVPAPQGMPKASLTCEDNGNVSTFVFMRPDQDLTIDLSSTDNVFCGAVVAQKLTVNLEGAGKFALFGLFVVKNLKVTGAKTASLHIHHPMEELTAEITFPGTISQDGIASQFERLSSSTIRNFFIPMAKSAGGTGLQPWGPAQYMQSCGGGLYRYRDTYNPIPNLAGYSDFVSGAANPLYIVDSSL